MKTYRVEIKDKKEIAENTLLFELEKPKDFQFKAGQFLMIILPKLKADVERGNFRPMSIASPPYYQYLDIAIRKGISPFKVGLQNMNPGDEVDIKGPYGVFTLPERAGQTLAFLVGGIGITPVRSMILQAIKDRLDFKLFLFYSNHRPEDAAFLKELSGIKSDNYKFIGTMTNMADSKMVWGGEIGFISLKMLKKYLPDIKEPIYYIVGPPGFVVAMKEILIGAGINKKNIKLEQFSGF